MNSTTTDPDVIKLLEFSRRLVKAAENDKWPLSEERRLDVLRLAKRVRLDAMNNETNIELLFISAAANGCRYVDDFADETGISKKEAAEILNRMWMHGTFERAEDRLHDRGRPRAAFLLSDQFSALEVNAALDDVNLLP